MLFGKKCIQVCALMLLFMFLAVSISVAGAPKYPVKPIQIVVPWGPGGTSSIIAQMLAAEVEPKLGVRVTVVNKPGASGATGTLYVKDTKPDGYTVLQTWIAPMVMVPINTPDIGYDPVNDFYHITQVSEEPVVVVCKKDRPWNTVKDFIEDAKKNPGKYSWSGGGALSVHTLFFKELLRNSGVEAKGVIYQGATAALPDLLGGTLDISSGTATFLALQPDELKAIGVFAEKRSAKLPDVPTIKELGLEAPTIGAWSGLAVHKGTPDYIKEKLSKVFGEVLNSEEFRNKMLKDANVEIVARSGDEYLNFIKRSIEQMRGPLERLKNAK